MKMMKETKTEDFLFHQNIEKQNNKFHKHFFGEFSKNNNSKMITSDVPIQQHSQHKTEVRKEIYFDDWRSLFHSNDDYRFRVK